LPWHGSERHGNGGEADAVVAGPDAAPSWEYPDTLDGGCRFVDSDASSWTTYSPAAAPNYLGGEGQR